MIVATAEGTIHYLCTRASSESLVATLISLSLGMGVSVVYASVITSLSHNRKRLVGIVDLVGCG